MTTTHLGWMLFIAALAMMLSLLAGDVAALTHWSDALYPAFVGGVLGHLGAVLAAFAGGKLLNK